MRHLSLAILTASLLAAPDLGTLTLEDQYQRPHRLAPLVGGPSIMLAGSVRKTADLAKGWVVKLRPKLDKGVSMWALADLHQVPFFVPNSSIRKSLRQDLPRTVVLCDWKGTVYKRLGLPRRSFSVVVFGSDGRVLASIDGVHTAAGEAQVLEALKKIK